MGLQPPGDEAIGPPDFASRRRRRGSSKFVSTRIHDFSGNRFTRQDCLSKTETAFFSLIENILDGTADS